MVTVGVEHPVRRRNVYTVKERGGKGLSVLNEHLWFQLCYSCGPKIRYILKNKFKFHSHYTLRKMEWRKRKRALQSVSLKM